MTKQELVNHQRQRVIYFVEEIIKDIETAGQSATIVRGCLEMLEETVLSSPTLTDEIFKYVEVPE